MEEHTLVEQFVLRIFFSGLMAFIPTDNGQELTILLLNANHVHHLSDGTSLAAHYPLLFARAGNCTGSCPTRDEDIAQIAFSDKTLAQALDALEDAVAGGGAWILSGNLAVQKGSSGAPDLPSLSLRTNVRGTEIIPTTATQRGDYSWLAKLSELCPSCEIDPVNLGTGAPSGIVAARLRLRSGNVFTYSVARIGSSVTPVQFKRLDGTGSASSYSQAVATWMGAEITVTGDDVEIVESAFDGSSSRSMRLEPNEDGEVEVAILNLPPWVPPATSPRNTTPGVGKHFEMYYELADDPPAMETRLVPFAGAAPGAPSYSTVSWDSIHPQAALWSELLNKIRLNIGRTVYELNLCPPANGGG